VTVTRVSRLSSSGNRKLIMLKPIITSLQRTNYFGTRKAMLSRFSYVQLQSVSYVVEVGLVDKI
jgi:hypothetical protein